MAEKTYWDSFKAEGENVIAKIKALVREGNVRRVVVQQDGRVVAEFPLTAGVIGAVLAPLRLERHREIGGALDEERMQQWLEAFDAPPG